MMIMAEWPAIWRPLCSGRRSRGLLCTKWRKATDPTSIHLHRNDPCRPPKWRWQRAQMLLISHESPSPERDDEFVELALRFLQEDHSDAQPPAPKHPLPMETRTVIERAQQIHDCDDVEKWMLQAWLLTGESLESSARRSTTASA